MTSPNDIVLGRLAVERGLLSADQLAEVLGEQKSAPSGSLGALLLRKGLVKQADLDALLEEQKRRLAGALDLTDPKLEDAILGRLLVKQGILKEAQLYECLRASAELGEAGGKPPRLTEILVRKGFLAPAPGEAPKHFPLTCPSCRSHFTTTDPDLQRKHLCKQCGAVLDRQEQDRGLGETTEALKVDMPEDARKVSKDPDRQFAGRYLLIEEVGRGGMGVVWKGWQKDLKRYVALKILAGSLWTDVEIKRFYREAQMAASLSHPNIASIYEVGSHDGKHFIAMEFVEGDSLAKLMTPSNRQGTTRTVKHLPPRRAIEILREAALATDYAHSKKIIHRDLKPHNIMVQRTDGRAYVMDFGLAKPIKSADSITISDAIVGTPQYMSPEQARGDAVDRRTDVFSLGAVLYHVLTGRPPFEGRSPAEIMMSVLADDPPPMRKLNSRIHADVETIVLKALDKDRDRRYDSARSLADDLGRYLEGEPIGARPLSRRERAWKALKRKPLQTAVGAAVAGAVLLAGVFLAVLQIQKQWRLAEWAESAHEAGRAKRWGDAMDWWERVLAERPGDEEALQGWELAKLNSESAQRDVDREVRRREAAIRDNHRNGELLYKADLFTQALGCYQAILALDPTDALAEKRKQACEEGISKKEREAAKLALGFEGLEREKSRRDEDDLRRRNARLAAMPDYEAARVTVERAARIRLSDDGYTAADVLALYREAREALSKAIAADPLYAEAYFFRGQLRHKMGEYDRGVDDFREALRLSTPNGPAAFAGAMSYLATYMIHAHTPLAPDPVERSEARDRMLEWASQALKSASVFERFCSAAVQQLERKDYPKAEDSLRTVSPAGRGHFFHHLLLASTALEAGNARAAEAELTFALKLEPVSLEALYLRAVARAKTDNLAGAMEDAKLALEVSPDSKEILAAVHLLKANLHHELNEIDPANASLRAALSVAPPRVAIVANRVAAQWARGAK